MKALFFKSISNTKAYKGHLYRIIRFINGTCTIICDTSDRKMLISGYHKYEKDAVAEFNAKINGQ